MASTPSDVEAGRLRAHTCGPGVLLCVSSQGNGTWSELIPTTGGRAPARGFALVRTSVPGHRHVDSCLTMCSFDTPWGTFKVVGDVTGEMYGKRRCR